MTNLLTKQAQVQVRRRSKLYRAIVLANAGAIMLSIGAYAQGVEIDAPSAELFEEVFIIGSQEDLQSLAGSATLIDSEAIEKFDATDINDLVSQAPGVYVRYEDGYGLRPNIGIRGVTSDRSQKITIMEDGILISPSPYSAPAAYYFPNVNRMHTLELAKGPAAIKYGPHTIGGAVNMVTRPVPNEAKGQFDATFGNDNFQKYRLFYGDVLTNKNEASDEGQLAYWVDALHYSADGFKELDNGEDTGFERNDFNVKVQWRSAQDARYKQSLALKLGYADEDSDETYLGLSDEDFALNPNRRYLATQLDHFVSDHSQVHVLHSVDFGDNLSVFTRAYYQRFNRSWNRFNGFFSMEGQCPEADDPGCLAIQDILRLDNPFPDQMALLRGEIDSNGNASSIFDITNNDREYGSQGVEVNVNYSIDGIVISHQIEVGLRLHHDFVDRHHKVKGYRMVASELVFDGQDDRGPKDLNRAETDALALFLNDEITWSDWTLNLGLRYENIEGSFDDQLVAIDSDTEERYRERSQSVVTPGLGLHYQWSDNLGLLAGIYQGFSPAGPSSSKDIDPEKAINYEYGLRYQRDTFNFSLIGFFSDYSNLIGRCRASDSGCAVGDEFNGGEIEVSGVELTASKSWALSNELTLPVSLVYTFTESSFQENFDSGFSQWGQVRAGDELPYLPENQLRLQVGLAKGDTWSVDAVVKYTDTMREIPGQGSLESGTFTPSYTLYDLSASWQINERLKLRLIGENLGDKQVIVSRRPFGARPNQPLSVKAGVQYNF